MTEDVIRAKRFEVVDDEGQVRISLDASEGDTATMAISDREGRNRAGFGILLDGSTSVILKDAKGNQRVALGVGGPSGDTPRLILLDTDGKPQVQLIIHDEGEVSLVLSDVWGQQRVILGVSEDSGLVLRSKDGRAVEGISTKGA